MQARGATLFPTAGYVLVSLDAAGTVQDVSPQDGRKGNDAWALILAARASTYRPATHDCAPIASKIMVHVPTYPSQIALELPALHQPTISTVGSGSVSRSADSFFYSVHAKAFVNDVDAATLAIAGSRSALRHRLEQAGVPAASLDVSDPGASLGFFYSSSPPPAVRQISSLVTLTLPVPVPLSDVFTASVGQDSDFASIARFGYTVRDEQEFREEAFVAALDDATHHAAAIADAAGLGTVRLERIQALDADTGGPSWEVQLPIQMPLETDFTRLEPDRAGAPIVIQRALVRAVFTVVSPATPAP
ncbi:MAG: SIMPL domain-containing protein [Vulcanimicrobiaceae bacterium]